MSHETLNNLDIVTTSTICFDHILRAKFICFPTKLCSVCESSRLTISEINWLCQGTGVASEKSLPFECSFLLPWITKKAECWKQLVFSNCVAGDESWESLGQQGDQSYRKSTQNIHWKDWCWNSSTLATWCKEPTHWKRPWCWARLKAGGEGDDWTELNWLKYSCCPNSSGFTDACQVEISSWRVHTLPVIGK